MSEFISSSRRAWEMPDSNSSGFSPLGFTILALVLNMAYVSQSTTAREEAGISRDEYTRTSWKESWEHGSVIFNINRSVQQISLTLKPLIIIHRAVCIGTEEMVKGKFFYAVRKGFKPGVYQTWDECKSQVDKFPYASYKKFAAEKDAWAFVRGKAMSITPDVSEGTSYEGTLPRRAPEALEYIPIGQKRHYDHLEEEEEEVVSPAKRAKPSQEASQDSCASSKSSDGFTYMGDAVVVYTDGCCSGNGKAGARAGIGVYWGRDHPLNVAEPLDGRQTNQRAELQAACKALEQAKEIDIKKLVLYTDSKFTINGVTSWVKNWKLNNWRLKSGGPIVNKEDFEKLDKLNEELEVVWLHIPGHAGYLGNEEADRLSREGAAKHLH